jgi:hypothetical protein
MRIGAWLFLLYTGDGQFGLMLQDRLLRSIIPSTFIPPAKFIISKFNVLSHFVSGLPQSTDR